MGATSSSGAGALSLLVDLLLFVLGLGLGVWYERRARNHAARDHGRRREEEAADSRFGPSSLYGASAGAPTRPGVERRSSNSSRYDSL